jgi:endonuclease/exonuclease/phosphatase family metal-dependent hydrolase
VKPLEMAAPTSLSLKVMTFNLHRDVAGATDEARNAWENRKQMCADLVIKYAPTIVCTQEGMKSQIDDLQSLLLAGGYQQFGVSKKGPVDPGDEHCAIFFDTAKVERVDGGTFWLSESPAVPASVSWGSCIPSISTWATFKIKGLHPPGFSFQIVNTHMDHNSSHARRRGALLTWQHIDSLPSNLPVVYCGGFNALKESRMGRFLLGRSQEHGLSGNLNDAWVSCAQRRNAHLVHTYHGFHGRKWGTKEFLKMLFRAFFLCWDWHNQDLHVDWILFRGSSLSPFLCEIMDDNVAGQYPSDHYPVCCQFTLPRNVRPEEVEPSP